MVSYRALAPAGHAGRGVALSYRAFAPGGAGFRHRTCAGVPVVSTPCITHRSSAGIPPPRLRSLAAHVIPARRATSSGTSFSPVNAVSATRSVERNLQRTPLCLRRRRRFHTCGLPVRPLACPPCLCHH